MARIIRYRRYGRLRIVDSNAGKNVRGKRYVRCLCDCGVYKVILLGNIKRGLTRSCGCLGREARVVSHTTHGRYGTRIYNIWGCMLQRCLNPLVSNYKRYGARGIKVCERWLKFENFYQDMGDVSDDKTLDRFPDNDGDYKPDNCRWATRVEQANNMRSNVFIDYKGQRLTVADAIEQHSPFHYSENSYKMVYSRISRGWSVEKALQTAIRHV